MLNACNCLALTDHNITPLTLPLSTSKRLLAQLCRSLWNESLTPVLRTTTMDLYRSDPTPQPWIRQTSRKLDVGHVALTRLRLGHTRLTAHLHRLSIAPDPYCPWCPNTPETIHHFLLECPRFHSLRVVLRDRLRALGVISFDKLTCPPCSQGQTSPRHGNQRCFATPVPSSRRPSNCTACETLTGISPGLIGLSAIVAALNYNNNNNYCLAGSLSTSSNSKATRRSEEVQEAAGECVSVCGRCYEHRQEQKGASSVLC